MAKLGVAPAQTASKGQHARPAQQVVHHGEPDRVHRHRRVTSQRRRCSAPCPVPSGTRVGSIEPLGDSPAQTAHAHALRTCDAGSDPTRRPELARCVGRAGMETPHWQQSLGQAASRAARPERRRQSALYLRRCSRVHSSLQNAWKRPGVGRSKGALQRRQHLIGTRPLSHGRSRMLNAEHMAALADRGLCDPEPPREKARLRDHAFEDDHRRHGHSVQRFWGTPNCR